MMPPAAGGIFFFLLRSFAPSLLHYFPNPSRIVKNRSTSVASL